MFGSPKDLSVTSFLSLYFFQEGPIQIKRNVFFQEVQAKMGVLKFHIKLHINI